MRERSINERRDGDMDGRRDGDMINRRFGKGDFVGSRGVSEIL